LVAAAFAAFGALAGYSAFRGRRWAHWAIFVQALLLAAFAIGYFVKWGFGWNHGSGDWSALAITLFSVLTLAALAVGKLHERAEQDGAPNSRPAS
jgi:peptidoglycan/LPS O-acetylase OafA/YrhL